MGSKLFFHERRHMRSFLKESICDHGQEVDKEVDKKWTGSGQEEDRKLTGSGKEVDRNDNELSSYSPASPCAHFCYGRRSERLSTLVRQAE